MNSRDKGKRGERLWRDELIAAGFDARRGQQFAGGSESPDVVCAHLPGIHFEVKFVEALNILTAMSQAIHDAKTKTPVVAHKRKNKEWLVTMRASDWLEMQKQLQVNEVSSKV